MRTGASHEGFAFAASEALPIVVVIEHNRWAFSTPSTRFAAVRDAAVEAVARARRGDGPTVIVAETYRMLGHAQHEAQRCVAASELAEWQARDPIAGFQRTLLEQGLATSEELLAIRHAAVEEGLADPMPDPLEARTGVYAASEPDATP